MFHISFSLIAETLIWLFPSKLTISVISGFSSLNLGFPPSSSLALLWVSRGVTWPPALGGGQGSADITCLLGPAPPSAACSGLAVLLPFIRTAWKSPRFSSLALFPCVSSHSLSNIVPAFTFLIPRRRGAVIRAPCLLMHRPGSPSLLSLCHHVGGLIRKRHLPEHQKERGAPLPSSPASPRLTAWGLCCPSSTDGTPHGRAISLHRILPQTSPPSSLTWEVIASAPYALSKPSSQPALLLDFGFFKIGN